MNRRPRSCDALVLLVVLALPAAAQQPMPIPHGTVATGARDISAAWLTEPTRRYRHAVLGDDVEAAAIAVRARGGAQYLFRLQDDSVFEDLTPRLADIDNDGRDEVWTVRSDAAQGARLEAYSIVEGELRRRFATSPIGTGYRWLNPVGVADFDGDGQREAAFVSTPHIGGILTIVQPDGARLVAVARRRGYSNHVLGSTRLDLSAIEDLDSDGGAEIVLPDQRRTQLVVVSLADGRLVERMRRSVPGTVDGALRLVRTGIGWRASYITSAGKTSAIEFAVLALKPLP